MPAQFPLRDFLLRLDAEGIRVRVRGLSPHRFGLTGERTLDAALIAQHPSGTAGEERTPAEPPVSLVRLLLLPISCDGRSDRRRDRHPSLSERPAGSGICAGQPTGTSPSIASPSTADQQTFPLTDRLTLTTTNGRTIERWKKSIPRYVRSYAKKVETQTRRQPSLTVKASREPQNPVWNQGLMEASSLKEEKISLSIQ